MRRYLMKMTKHIFFYELSFDLDVWDHPNRPGAAPPRLKKLRNLRGDENPDFGETIEKSRKIFFDCFVISETFYEY
jgi:hypothetical protein